MNRPSKIASFDVDAQKGFTPLCPDELPVPGGDAIGAALNQLASRAALRLGSKDAHSPKAAWVVESAEQMPRPLAYPDADLTWVSHCVPGTPGFELLDELPRPIDYDFFVWKGVEPDLHPYGACYHDLAERRSTGVIEYLRQNGVSHAAGWPGAGLLREEHRPATAPRRFRGAALPARLPGHRRGHRAASLRRDARRRGDPLRRPGTTG